MSDYTIDEWRPADDGDPALTREIDELAEILRAVVYVGAGVSFVVPFSMDESRAFWIEKVLPGVRAGTKCVLVACLDNHIVGTVQMDMATPPNQPHRAEVTKMLVHPSAQRRGIARALMIKLEEAARAKGRTLLTLDTWTGSHAETLYRSLDYVEVGVIPRYARSSTSTTFEPATFMFKELG